MEVQREVEDSKLKPKDYLGYFLADQQTSFLMSAIQDNCSRRSIHSRKAVG